ncbi:MAG: hypothetical protein ACWGMZ_07655 [Thermoguttaceae bacterium]
MNRKAMAIAPSNCQSTSPTAENPTNSAGNAVFAGTSAALE